MPISPVGSFAETSYPSQSGTAYPLQIDSNWAVSARIIDNFAPRPASPAAMTVVLDAGHVFNPSATTLTEISPQTVAIAAAPASGSSRIDRVVISATTGMASVVTGTANASPTLPAIPSGSCPVAQVTVSSTTTAITSTLIADERDFTGLGGGSMPTGSVLNFAGSAAPTGYLLCYGQAVSRTSYAALFAVISTTYGAGDGATTFNVPDLRGRVAAGLDSMGGTAANRLTAGGSGVTGSTLGGTGGAETVTISTSQMPSHTHGISDPGHNHAVTDPGHNHTLTDPGHHHGYATLANTGVGGGIGGSGQVNGTSGTTGTVTTGITNTATTTGVTTVVATTGITTTGTGGGASVNNAQPTLILNSIIKT